MKQLAVHSLWMMFAVVSASTAHGETHDAATWTAHLPAAYAMTADVTYLTADGIDLQLDVYAPRELETANPVVIYFHGGGWEGGSRERAVLSLMPWLEMGFTAVNATYRGSRVALAPAAVEDTRCVLHWVVANAQRYRFDIGRIVVTGDSAGSHLALMTGMLTAGAGFDRRCRDAPVPDGEGQEPRVAAVVNWSGATDVAELMDGHEARGFAVRWFGSQPERIELARQLSPLSHVRSGGPRVFTIHGDADGVVPHSQAARLHEALREAGVPNDLVTVSGGGHMGYSREQNERLWVGIRAFLRAHDLVPPSAARKLP